MQQRIEIVGIDGIEYCQIFQCSEMPQIGFEIDIAEGVRLTNLISPSPNLFDSDTFILLINSVLGITGTALINLISNYLYDILKNKKIIFSESETKINIIVKSDDKNENI